MDKLENANEKSNIATNNLKMSIANVRPQKP